MKKDQQQIYGFHPVMEALLSGKTLDKLFILKTENNPQIKDLISLARKMQVSVIKVPKEKLNKLCRANHQGVVAYTSPIDIGDIEMIIQSVFEQGEVPFFIMLDKVNDVRNLV